jgi:hypothetical protein
MRKSIEQGPPLAHPVIARAFQCIVRLWPAGSRSWALAIQAELPEITTTRESLLWLRGGFMSLVQAWWSHILFGATDEASAVSKRAGMTTAAVLLVVATVAFMLPGMPQGFMAVVDAWRGWSADQEVARLKKMGRQAELTRDANTLAFVAIHLPYSAEKNRWADRAVSLDPKLTWIYFQMQFFGGIKPPADPDFDGHVAQLEKWDRQNAVPFLMEANRISVPQEEFTNEGDYEARLAKNDAWLSAMDKAFRADHFDDYALRRFELDLSVQEQYRQSRPMNLASSLFASRIPNLMDVRIYADWLLHQGDRLQASGDAAGASACYWRVARFAQRMVLDSRDVPIKRLIALSIAEPSFEKLRDIANRDGKMDEGAYASYEIVNIQSALTAMRQRRFAEPEQSAVWSALMLHASAILIGLMALLSAISALWLMFPMGRTQTKPSAFTRWLLAISRFSAVSLVCATVVFYTHYVPVLRALRTASATNPETLHDFVRTFQGLIYIPEIVSSSWIRDGSVYFWDGVVALCLCSALVLIVRMASHGRLAKNVAWNSVALIESSRFLKDARRRFLKWCVACLASG